MRQSLNILFTPIESGLIPFSVSDDLPPGYYTAIQSWVLCFLTESGSRRLDDNYGTQFINNLRNGNLFTIDDVYSEFSTASQNCYNYCTPDSPGDVYVTKARVTDLDVTEVDDERGVVLYISFSFSDNTSTRINLEVA